MHLASAAASASAGTNPPCPASLPGPGLSAVELLGIHTDRPVFFFPAALGLAAASGTVLLSPDSDWGASHHWPLERWLELAGRLVETGQRVSVAGVNGLRGLAESLARELGETAGWCDVSVLGSALSVLAGYPLVIAADGSLAHLAAHAGATCVTLFGPNDPVWKRPLGRRHAVVRRHVECAPCLLAKCPLDARCQQELSTDRVWAAVREKLNS